MLENYVNKFLQGDAVETLKTLPDNIVDCCITSPPYFGLRDYGVKGQIGLEKTMSEYISKLVDVFSEVKRVLKPAGTLWLNLGDSYAGSGGMGSDIDKRAKIGMVIIKKYNRQGSVDGILPKNILGVPFRVAFALQDSGWIFRQDIIWHKLNPMPESVTDRCTKAHEYIFLLSKSKMYYYDYKAIQEPTLTKDDIVRDRDKGKLNKTPGRNKMRGLYTNNYSMKNKRSVWTVPTKPYKGAHFATFPEALINPMILAGSPVNGIVLDPFMGAGTVALASKKKQRNFIGIELNPAYIEIAKERLGFFNTF